jgi:hypothetical protein
LGRRPFDELTFSALRWETGAEISQARSLALVSADAAASALKNRGASSPMSAAGSCAS